MAEFALAEDAWPKTLPDAHRAVLRGIVSGLRRHAEILGLTAGGSFVSDGMDEFSDLDLVVVVRADAPGAGGALLKRRPEIATGLGPLLAAFTGEHVGEPRLLICLFGPPLVHVDLKFVTPDALTERVEEPVVLWDRSGEVRRRLATGRASYPAPDLQWIEDRFWTWVHYAATKAGRGEVFELLDFLAFLRGRVLGPLALEQAGAQPNGVRRLERLAPRAVPGIRATVAGYDVLDGVRGIHAAVAAYRKLREGSRTPIRRRAAAEEAAVAYLNDVATRLATTSPA